MVTAKNLILALIPSSKGLHFYVYREDLAVRNYGAPYLLIHFYLLLLLFIFIYYIFVCDT